MLTSHGPGTATALETARRAVESALEQMARDHEDLARAALGLGKNLQELRALQAGPPGMVRLRIVGLLAMHMMYGKADVGGESCTYTAQDVADYVNRTGWRIADMRGKPRRVTKHDVRRGLDLLDL